MRRIRLYKFIISVFVLLSLVACQGMHRQTEDKLQVDYEQKANSIFGFDFNDMQNRILCTVKSGNEELELTSSLANAEDKDEHAKFYDFYQELGNLQNQNFNKVDKLEVTDIRYTLFSNHADSSLALQEDGIIVNVNSRQAYYKIKNEHKEKYAKVFTYLQEKTYPDLPETLLKFLQG